MVLLRNVTITAILNLRYTVNSMILRIERSANSRMTLYTFQFPFEDNSMDVFEVPIALTPLTH